MKKFIGCLLIIIGLAIIGAGIFFNINDLGRLRGVKTEAIIVYLSNEGRDIIVTVNFEVNGKRQIARLENIRSDMEVGGVIDIYYNPDNPESILSADIVYATYIMMGIGLVVLIIGTVVLFKRKADSDRKVTANVYKKVMKYKYVVTAHVVGVKVNVAVVQNGISPMIVEANCRNPKNGRTYLFRSEDLWFDARDIVMKAGIRTLPVHVNPNNYKEYVMDLSSITKYTK